MTQANITYLFHSGYSVETATRFLVFDYYQPSENLQFLTSRSFQTTPPAWVFASHSHGDHFDPVIFSWDSPENPITYVLSDDVFPKRIPPGHRCHVLKEGESLSQDGLVITAYGSSDLGLSFLVEADGLRLFTPAISTGGTGRGKHQPSKPMRKTFSTKKWPLYAANKSISPFFR